MAASLHAATVTRKADPRAPIAMDLFNRLNSSGISYCILRDHEQLPVSVGHDLDLAVVPTDLSAFERQLKQLADDQGLTIIEGGWGFNLYAVLDFQSTPVTILRLDVTTTLSYRGISWLNIHQVCSDARHERGIKVASPAHAAVIRLVKEALHRKKFREDVRGRLQNEVRSAGEGIISQLGLLFPQNQAAKLVDLIVRGEWAAAEDLLPRMRRRFLIKRIMRHPLSALSGFTAHVSFHFRQRRARQGKMAVLVGPDGSGKTTLSESMRRTLDGQIFRHIHYAHGRFRILPDLRVLIGRGKSRCDVGSSTKLGAVRHPHKTWKSIMYLLYYTFNFILSHPLVWYRKSRGDLVVCDRYFYDYFLQPEWANIPRKLARLCLSAIPQPDVVIFAFASPDCIFTRKPELTLEEITRQQQAIESIENLFPRTVRVDTSRGEDNATADAIRGMLEVAG